MRGVQEVGRESAEALKGNEFDTSGVAMLNIATAQCAGAVADVFDAVKKRKPKALREALEAGASAVVKLMAEFEELEASGRSLRMTDNKRCAEVVQRATEAMREVQEVGRKSAEALKGNEFGTSGVAMRNIATAQAKCAGAVADVFDALKEGNRGSLMEALGNVWVAVFELVKAFVALEASG